MIKVSSNSNIDKMKIEVKLISKTYTTQLIDELSNYDKDTIIGIYYAVATLYLDYRIEEAIKLLNALFNIFDINFQDELILKENEMAQNIFIKETTSYLYSFLCDQSL